MVQRSAMLAILLGCGPSGPGAGPAPSPDRPNILLITVDTLRADALGAYGNTRVQTPVLDQVARDGVRFDRAFTVTPLTIPAHSSIFTGLWPPRHGVRDNGDFYLSDDAVTLAEHLQAAGYHTMASVGAEVTSRHWGFQQGFDAYFDDMGPASRLEENRWRVERRGDLVVADAARWLEQNLRQGLWFAWVHLFDCHYPYEAPAPFGDAYPALPYLGEVAWADLQVGRLVAALEKAGHLDRTILVVTGDHGEGLGEDGEQMHGMLLHNATTRIPMFIRLPDKARAGEVARFPASLVDLAPTLLGLVGLPVPDDLDGIDLSPWLQGEADPPHDRSVTIETLYPWRHFGWAPQRALVTPAHKLVDSTTPQLYETSDLAEDRDLAPGDPTLVADLRARLAARYAAMVPLEAVSDPARLDPDRAEMLLALGYLASPGLDSASDGFGQGAPDPRPGAMGEVERARQALRRGAIPEARRLLDELDRDNPGLLPVSMMRATLLQREGDLEGAWAIVAEVDGRHPSSMTKGVLGQIALAQGRVPEALDLLEQSVDTDPSDGQAWSAWLHALFVSGDLPALDAAVERARQVVPQLVALRAIEGSLLVMQRRYDEAEPLLKGVLLDSPDEPLVNFGLGLVARERGDAIEAERYLREEIRVAPPAPGARRALVELLVEQERYEEQLVVLQSIARLQPEDVLTRHAIAQASYNLGRYAEADAAVDACVALAPRYPECALLKANTLARLGRRAEAEAAYQHAIELKNASLPR